MINPIASSRIEIICGPMFSGKTEELIRRLKRLKYSRTDFILFKPELDNRYSEDEVVTHDRQSLKSISVSSATEILSICEQESVVKVIAIDESQFFLKQEEGGLNLVTVVQTLKSRGYRIILNGLDMDFMGNPYGLMPQLLAIADEITKLHSVCLICGGDANMSYRKSQEEDILQLGSQDLYEARCYTHWLEGQKKKLIKP